MVAKISIYDSYMEFKNPIWSFVRSFNAHRKLMQQFQLLTLYTTYGILVPYMVLTWSIYGSYMVHIWFLYGPYMVLKCFLHGSGMFLTWLLPCPLKVITTKPLWLDTWWLHDPYMVLTCFFDGSYMVPTCFSHDPNMVHIRLLQKTFVISYMILTWSTNGSYKIHT